MSSIVTVASTKGGAGKTALCMVLAANLAAMGRQVAVLDADPNASFSDWHGANYEGAALFCLVEVRETAIVESAQRLADTHDLVLIDTAGFGNQTALMAMGTPDLVLIPVMPDRHSVREAIRTAAQVASVARLARRPIPIAAIGMRWRKDGLAERAAAADLGRANLRMTKSALPALSALDKATFSGVVPLTGQIGSVVDRLLAELDEIAPISGKAA